MCGPAIAKNMWNPRWRPRMAGDDRLIAKILIMTIQVNLVPNRSETWRGNTNSAELSLLKFLLLAYHHHWAILGRHLGFHIFFHNGLLGGRTTFFTAGLFLDQILNVISFQKSISLPWHNSILIDLWFTLWKLETAAILPCQSSTKSTETTPFKLRCF